MGIITTYIQYYYNYNYYYILNNEKQKNITKTKMVYKKQKNLNKKT